MTKKFKKYLSVLLALTMIFSLLGTVDVFADTTQSSNGDLPETRTNRSGDVERLFFVNFYNDDDAVLHEDVAFYTGDGVHYPSETPPTSSKDDTLIFNYWGLEDGTEVDLLALDPTENGLVAGAVVDLYAYYTTGNQSTEEVIEYIIRYVDYNNSEDIAEPYKLSIQKGDTLEITNKNITGFVLQDPTVTTTVVGEDPTKLEYIVNYVENTVLSSYTVEHQFPAIGGTDVISETITVENVPVGSIVHAIALDKEGFISTGGGNLSSIVSPSGDTALTVEYLRKKNYILIDSNGGSQQPATNGEYDEDIDLSYIWDVERSGYELQHYIDAATGQKYAQYAGTNPEFKALPTKMPADSMTLKAVWNTDDTEVIVNYYVEKEGIVGEVTKAENATRIPTRPPIDNPAIFPGSLTQAQIDSADTWTQYSTTTVSAKTGDVIDSEFLEPLKAQIPGEVDGVSYRELAKVKIVDATGGESTDITGNGTTTINLYYSSKVYMAQFVVEKGDDVNGVFTYESLKVGDKTYQAPFGEAPAAVDQLQYVDFNGNLLPYAPATEKLANPHLDTRYYHFFYKYGEDISDKWPYPDGTNFTLEGGGEGSEYYGWRTAGETVATAGKDPLQTIVYTNDLNVAGPELMASSGKNFIQFYAVGTSKQSLVNIYLEQLEGEVIPDGVKTIEYEGVTYVNYVETDNLSPGINYLPNVVSGYTNVSSYNEKDIKGNIVPVGGTIGTDGIIDYLATYEDLDGDGVDDDLRYNFIYKRDSYDITFDTGYASTSQTVPDILYQTKLLPYFQAEVSIGGTADTGWLPTAEIPAGELEREFLGWSLTAQNGATELPEELKFDLTDLDTMPARNVIVHAWWQTESYDITFKLDEDDTGTTLTFPVGTPLAIPLQYHFAYKEGHIFEGWILDDDPTIIAVPVGEPIQKDATYTLQWREVNDLQVQIIHKYTDDLGVEYTYTESLENQLLGSYVGATSHSTRKLRENGFPTNLFYTPETNYIYHQNKIIDNVIVFEYTANEKALYNVKHVDEFGQPIGTGIDVAVGETDFETITIIAAEIDGYEPIQNAIQKNLLDDSTNTFLFVYKKIIPEPVQIDINFYTPNGSSFTLDDTITSSDYALGEVVDNILLDSSVKDLLDNYLLFDGLVPSSSTITSKVIASNTEFNIYLQKESSDIAPLAVSAQSITKEYNANEFTIPTDDIKVSIYGNEMTIEAAGYFGVDIKVVDVPPHLLDGTEENLLDTTLPKDVDVTELWVIATQTQGDGFVQSASAGFTHTVTPYPVTIVVDNFTRTLEELDPAIFGYEITHNNFFAGDDITISVDKTQATPDVGQYPGILVADVQGSDVGNYALTIVNGNVEITPLREYTVIYDNNGGSGEMADQLFDFDIAGNLTTNTFTNNDKPFLGWALSPTGPVIYTDNQSVINLVATPGGSITLFAIWETDNHTVIYPGVNPNPEGELPEESFEVEDGDKVIVDNNDGTPPKELIIDKDTTIEEPTRDGYIFEGYTFDPSTNTLTATWSKATPDTGDSTQVALWITAIGCALPLIYFLSRKKKSKNKN